MLIATLPTFTGSDAKNLSEEILSHPLVGAARYNTGGDSPYSPKEILEALKPLADYYKKNFYIDLEGRQMRVAKWSPHSRGSVVLNRNFDIELPGKIHFRGAGWFDIANVSPAERKVFFRPRRTRQEWYFGESQSVNVVAKRFEVKGYLGGLDFEYIKAGRELGISRFMLSFFESEDDLADFFAAYYKSELAEDLPAPDIVLKIESLKGMKFIRKISPEKLGKYRLMAARDDLFLSMAERRASFLGALKLIARKDSEAIVASRLMSGLSDYAEELSLGDMADLALMGRFGYRHFMFSDGMAQCFDLAMRNWEDIALPILEKYKRREKNG